MWDDRVISVFSQLRTRLKGNQCKVQLESLYNESLTVECITWSSLWSHVCVEWGLWLLCLLEDSVAKLCPALCDPVDYSTPGFPLHHLPEVISKFYTIKQDHNRGPSESSQSRPKYSPYSDDVVTGQVHIYKFT